MVGNIQRTVDSAVDSNHAVSCQKQGGNVSNKNNDIRNPQDMTKMALSEFAWFDRFPLMRALFMYATRPQGYCEYSITTLLVSLPKVPVPVPIQDLD
ncbi:hypothetical protein Pdw03_3115 [Penicillium digitatum]|uniref:Uncharacterized protein n=1 Tax=Penicillium digitatum TaxID=36651 RepID=A0A7T7BHS5_PENDI|nr:hypothetical protein Pdw03_3115 [Penicillium digitatum]